MPPVGSYDVKWLDSSYGPLSFDKSKRFHREGSGAYIKQHHETHLLQYANWVNLLQQSDVVDYAQQIPLLIAFLQRL